MSGTAKWTPPAPGEVPAPNLPETHADIHTHANLFEVKPLHIDIDWTVDWERRVLSGGVTHTVRILKDGVDRVTFDTSFLDIKQVSLAQSKGQTQEAKFTLGKRKGTLGSPLTVEVGRRRKDDELNIVIHYNTTEQCTALGWLGKEQTESGTMPFLYSQAQAIHARAMLPCVDSPSHKVTYTSKVQSKYPVLMSALAEGAIRASETQFGDARLSQEEDGIGVYRFRQPIGVPTYLIAIVGGNLVFRELAPRVGVWAEPTMIDRAEWEFKEDANRFLIAAEQTISPYSWTRYDCVVLPPSFPYGGMENANLTTLTPTLISGDRSQTDVLLHELAHSWSGNLTSCANWTSFWLNEGINVWIERLLLSVVHGPEAGPAMRGLSYIIGRKGFEDAVDQFPDKPRFQRLVPTFKDGEDPDDGFSSIPYEKGSTFILYLERLVGGLDIFLPFIRSHFKAFYDRSVSTEEWKQHLYDFYAGNPDIIGKLDTVDWNAWFYGEGKRMPAEVPFEDSLARQAYKLAQRWTDVITKAASGESHRGGKFGPADIAGWDPNQVVLFLGELRGGPSVPAAVASEIDAHYGFNEHKNTEIRSNFYGVALQDKDGKYAADAAAWVARQGRMKYCRPLYRSLFKVEPALAKKTFLENKSFYHPIAAAMIEIDLGLSRQSRQEPKDGSRADGVGRKKLLVVCGSTGTGKSQLAVELARHLDERHARRAEVISADSMQMYRGLDVITNKATQAEMVGVPHHLISILDAEQGEECDVGTFVRQAKRIIERMHGDGRIPIVCGGTNYYVQHLLLPGHLVSASADESSDKQSSGLPRPTLEEVERLSGVVLDKEQRALLQRLANDEPDDRTVDQEQIPALPMWELLRLLDAEMADRWHFRDTRKVLRSLRVLIETGKRHSQWLSEQRDRHEQGTGQDDVDRLVFWLYCDMDTLGPRLDARVDKMIECGLLREIGQLRATAKQLERSTGRPIDYTRGIFQTIGYKEFDVYLGHRERHGTDDVGQQLLPSPLDEHGRRLFSHALDAMKIGTRQYAKRQVSWLRNKLAPAILRQTGNTHLIVLDASDVERWETNVKQSACHITDAFLADKTPLPSLGVPVPGPRMTKHSTRGRKPSDDVRDRALGFDVCPICSSDGPDSTPYMVMRTEWDAHQHGRIHRAAMRKRGLLPAQGADHSQEAQAKRAARQARRGQQGSTDDTRGSGND